MKRLLIPLISLSLLGCKDDLNAALDKFIPPAPPVQLPAETQRGANTFGCLLNGEVWEGASHGSLGHIVPAVPNVYYSLGHFQLSAAGRTALKDSFVDFDFNIPHLVGPGVYYLITQPGQGNTPYAQISSVKANYSTNSTHTGTLIITALDTVSARKFVAGRFEFTAQPTAGAPAGYPTDLTVTQGRFDVELNRP